jgi:hypothetical protein
VKQFPGFERLGDDMVDVEANHVFMGDLGVDADHVRVVEGADEGQITRRRGEVQIAPWFVRLRLERKPEVVLSVADVGAQEIQRLSDSPESLDGVLRGVDLGALPAAPEDVEAGAQLDAEINGAHRLLQRVGADVRIVRGERAIAKDGIREEIRRRHWHAQPGVGDGPAKVANQPITLRRAGIDRHEVIVMQVDAVGADVAQAPHGLDRREHGPRRIAERIATPMADRPEAEREAVGGRGIESGGHAVSNTGAPRVMTSVCS